MANTVIVLYRNHLSRESRTSDTYEAVALVTIPDDGRKHTIDDMLEYAYRWTQNVQGSWSMKIGPDANDYVKLLSGVHQGDDGKQYGLKSTSMYDRMILDGELYEVESFGFRRVELL